MIDTLYCVSLPIILATFLAGCTTKPHYQDCSSDPVVMVIAGDTLDGKRMREYGKAIADSGLYVELAGYYMNEPRPIAIFEGDISERYATLMVRFPSLQAAKDFWYSDVYQQTIKPMRLNPSAGDYTVTVYREIDLPAYVATRAVAARYTGDACL